MDLAELTTLRVGGEAEELLSPATPAELIEAALEVWASGDDWLLLGGGSNVVVADEGFPGTVIRVVTRGLERLKGPEEDGTVLLRVQAGEPWDGVVALAVENGWAGIEALSGIPGSAGAAPIQNIGAYGQELASSLVAVEFLDQLSGELARIPAEELELGYRTSAFKRGRLGVVVSIDLRLTTTGDGLGEPIAYPQLASALGAAVGDRLPLADVRRAVLALRGSKGMVLDPTDPDSVSAGSFFTNPIVSSAFAHGLPADAPRWPMEPEARDRVVALDTFAPELLPPVESRDGGVKLSAAWLIERSGVTRGFRLPGSRAAISGKHTLALVNTGGATAEQIGELARYVQTRVLAEFGVALQPEPILVGVQI